MTLPPSVVTENVMEADFALLSRLRNLPVAVDCLCWLCLHLGLLTENHLSACLRGWLGPGLDAAETWDGEHTCLLDFLCGNSNKAVQDIRTVLGLHVMLSGDRLQQLTLCHCLRRARLHCLHGSHCEVEGRYEAEITTD